MDCLPLDLWAKILANLPCKTIIQCTSVCKSWNSLIKSPNFINIHMKQQPNYFILIKRVLTQGKGQINGLYCDEDETLDLYAGVRVDPPFNPPDCQIIGFRDGVICARHFYSNTYMLWNPSIQKCLEIPGPEIKEGLYLRVYGFWFDSNTDDFMIVRMGGYVDIYSEKRQDLIPLLDIKLYSPRTGSWRNIAHLAKDIEYGIPESAPHAFLHGAAHWLGAKNESVPRDTTIILFHFSDELFYSFETPSAVKFHGGGVGSVEVAVIQRSLSVIDHFWGRCVIWVMGEYGDSSSWTKRLDIVLLEINDRIIGIRKNGEFLIKMCGEIFSFEHKNALGKEHSIKRELNLHIKKLYRKLYGSSWDSKRKHYAFQRDDFVPNPKSALKYLGLACDYAAVYCESFVETLALLGTTTSSHIRHEFEDELENITGTSIGSSLSSLSPVSPTEKVEYECFVGGLTRATNEETLGNAFSQYGHVVESKIIYARKAGRSRGIGSLRDAIRRMNGVDLDGGNITVNDTQSHGSGGGTIGNRDRLQ